MRLRILIAGGRGFLGQVLKTYFTKKGYQVYCLTRTPKQSTDVYWDGETYGEWIHTLNQCDVLINLAGKSVNCRYNESNKKRIYDSRIKSTKILGQAIKISKTPPKLWINSSTATIYAHSEDTKMTEKEGVIGTDFSMNIAKSWEKTVYNLSINNAVRQVLLRTSVVLGKEGEAFNTLNKLVKWGLGGRQGSGKQMVSWIHELDFARGIDHIINTSTLEGPVNLTSPCPIRNTEFMKTFRAVNQRTFGLSHPTLLLKIGAYLIGTESELLLKSRYVVPVKLLDSNFEFTFPKIKQALVHLAGK